MAHFSPASIYAAYQLEAMAIPDFVAGFVYGMTGDNHLTELEACYDGSTSVIVDVQKAVSEIEAGDYIRGFAKVGTIINEFPSALTTCQNMDEDIAAIESWATIFTEPERLAKTLTKNWALHRRTIKEDLANESQDWADGNYFQAGIDTALAMTEAVGPIETTPTSENGITDIPEFVAGFIYGVTGDLDLEMVQTCLSSVGQLDSYVTSFIADLEHFKLLAAIGDLQKFIFHLQKDLAPCTELSGDIKKIEQWAAILAHPTELGESVSYNYLTNKSTVEAEIAKEKSDMSTGDYFTAGIDMADLSTTLIGPAPTEIVEQGAVANISVHEVNYLLAGFIYGMTSQNHLTELEACYTGGAKMIPELETAIADFKAGGWNYITQGCLNLVLVGLQIPQELHTCESMQDDLSAIASWASVFTDETELISTVTKHYLFHKKEVTSDLGQLKTDMTAQEFFHAGEDIATLASVLIGPIE